MSTALEVTLVILALAILFFLFAFFLGIVAIVGGLKNIEKLIKESEGGNDANRR